MIRARSVLLALAIGTILGLVPVRSADAIETLRFGVAPAGGGAQAFHLADGSTGQLRVFNKTDQPMVIELSAATASVDPSGSVAIGGVARGVEFEEDAVRLDAQSSRDVTFHVDGRAPATGPAAVVLAQIQGGDQPGSVVERLAVAVYLDGVPGPAVGDHDTHGRWAWALAATLAVVLVGVGITRAARRRWTLVRTT